MNRREYAGTFSEEIAAPLQPGANGRDRDPFPIIGRPALPLKATPFVFREPRLIPPRQWVYTRHLIRGFISSTLSAGGAGKSSLALADTMAMVTGRNLIGDRPVRQLRVWYWNLEDPLVELERRVAAICRHYGILPDQVGDRLFVNSGRDTKMIIAKEERGNLVICEPVIASFKSEIIQNKIDVWMIDPFVRSHGVPENDNGRISAVCELHSEIAGATNSAGELYHHVRKGQSGHGEYTVEDGRGAVALRDAVRSARVANVMTEKEAQASGIDTRLCRWYFRIDYGKANLSAPPDKTDWRYITGVRLGNATEDDSEDDVGVVTAWAWPNPLDGVSTADLVSAQAAVAEGGPWREDSRAQHWVGRPVAKVLRLNPGKKQDRAKVRGLLKIWIENGMFEVFEDRDEKRKTKRFVRVGELASAPV
jgi:AAA domain